MLFGAQAVLIWGRPRTTADVDVTADVDPADAANLVATMRELAFELRIADWVPFVAKTRVLPFVHGPTGIPVDVVLAGPGLEQQFLSRAIVTTIGSAEVPVMSPEDVVVTKLLAGRPKDLEDVRGIVRQRGASLDADYVRGVLRLLEQALSRGDLQQAFESELARLSS